MAEPFWKTKTLDEMSDAEWESLCDGCGLCCMHKIEDEQTGDIYYTNLACRLFDLKTCACSDYANRTREVPDCMSLRQNLLDWHPLVSGDPNTVHEADISVLGKALSEKDTNEWTVAQKLDEA